MNICVGNLPRDTTGSALRAVFESFGRVETVDVVLPRWGEESRGVGFVGMSVRSEAVYAVLRVHGTSLNGQTITATEVRPRDPTSGACRARCPCRGER
jgi:RNA recognition motif-containing protein